MSSFLHDKLLAYYLFKHCSGLWKEWLSEMNETGSTQWKGKHVDLEKRAFRHKRERETGCYSFLPILLFLSSCWFYLLIRWLLDRFPWKPSHTARPSYFPVPLPPLSLMEKRKGNNKYEFVARANTAEGDSHITLKFPCWRERRRRDEEGEGALYIAGMSSSKKLSSSNVVAPVGSSKMRGWKCFKLVST